MKRTLLFLLLPGLLFAAKPNAVELANFGKDAAEMAALRDEFMNQDFLDELKGDTPDVLKLDTLIAAQMGTISFAVADMAKTYESVMKMETQIYDIYGAEMRPSVEKALQVQRGVVAKSFIDSLKRNTTTVTNYSKKVKNLKLKVLIMKYLGKTLALNDRAAKLIQ